MSFRNISILIVLALSLPGSLSAIQITGKVAAVNGDTATIAIDGDVLPTPGDKAEIFFKMPGVDVDVSVANGHVQEITGQNIMVEIDNATATVSKGQLVRIKSPSPKKRTIATATPSTTPSAAAAFLGVQMITDPAGTNGAPVQEVVPESPAAAAGFQVGDLIVAVDGSTVENAAQVIKAVAPLSPGTRHAFLVSRDGKLQKLDATLARLPPDFATPAGPNPLLGDWTAVPPPGGKVSFSFKEDNTLLWVIEEPTSSSAYSATGKYRVDTTVTPNVVEVFDIEGGDLGKGQTLHGFFELQSDGRLKFDLSEKQERGFSDRETILLSRATSPVVPYVLTVPNAGYEAAGPTENFTRRRA